MDIQVAATSSDPRKFEIVDAVLDEPRADEILIRIVGVGVCHTDLFFRDKGMIPTPAVLGHEGAGIVERVGAEVTKVSPGDHVILTFRSCGTCPHCNSGDPAYCTVMQELNYLGRRTDGSTTIRIGGRSAGSNFFGQSSFATHALAYERNVVKVDADVDLMKMGPLACSVQTGVGAVLRSLRCHEGSSIVIGGGGAVGLSAVMGAKLARCEHIVLVEPLQSRRALALEFGATRVVDPENVGSLGRHLRDVLPQGFDFGFDTTGIGKVQNSLIGALKAMGVLGLVGVSASDAGPPGTLNDIIARGLTLRGIIEGDSDPDSFLPLLLEHHKAGRLPFDRMVKVFPFDSINDAIASQHDGGSPKVVLSWPRASGALLPEDGTAQHRG